MLLTFSESLPIIAELAGLAAFLLVTAAFFFRAPRTILSISVASSLFWVLHFGLVGAWAGLITSIASGVRNGAGAWLEHRNMVIVTWICAALVIITGLIIDPAGWIVLIAAPSRAIANHLRSRELLFRLACSVSGFSYIAYGLSLGSTTVWLSSAITVSVILGTPLVRYLRNRTSAASA
jgi:UPF0716 family protein affecting phage T7 exclusion